MVKNDWAELVSAKRGKAVPPKGAKLPAMVEEPRPGRLLAVLET